MFKKIRNFLILILVGAVLFAGYVISLDSSFEVSRERKIVAPANLIFQQIADLKNWDKWSPLKDKDSTIQFEYNKSTQKEGDYFRFTDSDGKRQKVTNLTLAKDSLIKQSMASNDMLQELEWQIQPDGNEAVVVKWTVKGELPIWQRIYAKKMDNMIGPKLTRGLELLDKSVHRDMEKHETYIQKVSELSSTYYIYKSTSCKKDSLGAKMDKLLPEVLIYALKHQIPMNGKPFTIYNKWDEENNSIIFSSCIPTKEKVVINDADILTGQTPGGAYLKAHYQGAYKFLRTGWNKAYQYIAQNEKIIIDSTREPFEIYTLGHTKSLNPADWVTEIYIPVLQLEADKQNIQ